MGKDVSIEKFSNIDFPKTEMPTNITVSIIKSICVGQIISIKAKVYHLTPVKKVQSGKLQMVEAHLVDPTGTIKMILWQSFVAKIQLGKTYL